MRRIAIGIGAALALSAGASLSAVPASGQGPVSTSFTTPGTTTFTVPAGICSVTVDVRGAQGGDATGVLSTDLKNKFQSQDGNSQPTDAEVAAAKARAADLGAQDDTGAGGLGGEATATLTVTPGEVLAITVGEAGGDIETKLPNGGAPDGGSGAVGEASGAGGGGSSDVRQGGSDLAHRVLVGGGGGGGGVGFFLFESLTEDGGGG